MGEVVEAPCCLTRTLTNGNTLCTLIQTSIPSTCHVKTLQVIYRKVVTFINIWYASIHQFIETLKYKLHCGMYYTSMIISDGYTHI